jgi:signal transduction histidine kinase
LEKRRLSLEARRLRLVEQRADELTRAKEEMEHLDRYKTQFMWTMAHELRSPVGGALSLLRTLRHSVGSTFTAQQMDILGRIERRMDRLMDLINDLLALAGSKAVEPDEPLGSVSLKQTLSRVVDEFRVEAMAKSIQLNYIPLEGEVCVQGTEDGLIKIFSNLIGNAIKYTHENGQVEVQVVPESDRIKITVSDTGIGIPEAEMPALFEEFYRATNAKKAGINGTGLGLSIVKQYVERFGGQIDVNSVEGRGSEFTVRLVIVDQKT